MKMINNAEKVLLALFLVSLATCMFFLINADRYSLEVINNNAGWGYNIRKGEKMIIHQPNMPVIYNIRSFPTKKSARAAGKLVIRKLRRKESPAISRNELELIIK